MRTVRTRLIHGVLLAVAVALAGCNTVEGIGKDLKSGGKAIEKTAEDAKN
jgi:predicted small secreted protein